MREPATDTIVAVSTPFGYGGLGIVRLSGVSAKKIAREIFRPRKERWNQFPARRMVLGDVRGSAGKELIDEAYLVYFPAPMSYTREDVIEISCHGSPVVLEEIVRQAIQKGARHADPGEFTLRAFLNGRIDILQAEAVNDLITAGSLEQARVSYGQLRGNLSKRLAAIREKMVRLVSSVEAGIEFPDEGLPLSIEKIGWTMKSVADSARRLIESYETGRILREGLTLAIVGRTNVGKSTLFNALLDQDRAIVSSFPGTTRDYLRERLRIKNAVFHLVDMAGLDRASHPVEEKGIERSRRMASEAEAVLLVVDGSRPETAADLKLIRKFGRRPSILLFNKSDLETKIDKEKCLAEFGGTRWLEISALRKANLDRLKDLIHASFVPDEKAGKEMILHLREKLLLEQVLASIEESLRLLRQGYSDEVWAEEIRTAISHLGKLSGEISAEEIIKDIFSRFCVGK